MKKIYSALAIFVAAGLCVSAQVFKSVTVNLAGGSKTGVNLSDELVVVFNDEYLVITGGEQEVSVPRAQIESFTFSETEYSGIDRVNVDPESAPVMHGGSISFSSLPDGSSVAVYTANGALVSQATVTGSYSIDLSTLPVGTLLVNVNGVAYKIAVKK